MRTLQFVSCVLVGVIVANGAAGVGWAEEASDRVAAIAPLVNEDTFLAAFINVAALPKADAANIGKLTSLLPQLGGDAQVAVAALQGIGGIVENVRAAGIDAVYAVVGLQDANTRGGPLVVFHIEKPEKRDAALSMLKGLAAMAGTLGPPIPEVRAQGVDMVCFGSVATLDRYAKAKPGDRTDLLKPLARLASEGAVLAAVVCPGPDARRVVRELWPALPGRLAPLSGDYADRWLHFELAVNASPDAKPRLALEARDPEAAAFFAKLYSDLPGVTTEFGHPGEGREKVKGYAQLLVDALPARVEGMRATIELPTDEARIAKLRSMFAEASDAAMESTRRRERMNQFKQLALAMLNYESANKHYPPAAICDKEGRPLLSWRVAVLPYLEEGAIYKQFHLDEPWDSPHNRTLIEKMPAVYADPKLKQAARAGKTTYQVPAGPETIFHDNVGTAIRDVTDGTSKTILIVEVEPSRAVEWTKPQDWEVDLQKPRQGLAAPDRTWITTVFADGSAQMIKTDVDVKQLQKLLMRADGEVVDRP